jgi:large subunit ribosomal protein L24
MKLKKGDTVKILSGKDRGKRGKVLGVFPKGGRILVEGVNVKKRHRRSRRPDRKGEIVLLPAPFPAATCQLICPKCSRPTRVGMRQAASGAKVRVCKKCLEGIA